jgi:hypothetical protein
MIVVCGDSWCTPDTRIPGKHFSELISNRYKVLNFARGGISNTGICLQIQEALKYRPEAIVVHQTDSARMEVPVGEFNARLGLKNIKYVDKISASYGCPQAGQEDAPIVSDVIYTLVNDNDWTILGSPSKYNLSNDKKEAVKQYIAHIFDYGLKEAVDNWALGYWYMMAKKQGVTVINSDDFIKPVLNETVIPEGARTWVYGQYTLPVDGWEWMFHTDFETQEKIATKLLEQLLIKGIKCTY